MTRAAALGVVLAGCTLEVGERLGVSTGSVALAPDESIVYAVDTDNDVLLVHDAETLEAIAQVKVGRSPRRLEVGIGGDIYVANRMSRSVSVVRPTDWRVARTLDACVDPVDLKLSADSRALYVLCGASALRAGAGELVALDAETGARQWAVAIPSEPRSLVLIDGDRALVSHLRSDVVERVDLRSGVLSRPSDDPASLAADGVLVATKTGTHAYLFTRKVTGGERDRALSVDFWAVIFASMSPGSPGPRLRASRYRDVPAVTEGLLTSGRGNWLDTGFMSVDRYRGNFQFGDAKVDVGIGADGLAALGRRPVAFAYSQFEHRLSRLVFEDFWFVNQLAEPVGDVLAVEVVEGRKLFHSIGGAPCAACHLEGRDDGKLWNVLGTFRATPTLAGRGAALAPRLAATVDAILDRSGVALAPRERDALLAYVSSMPAPDAPLREASIAGRRAFEKARCAECHPAPDFTTGATVDLGRGEVDIPSLVGVARSPPYLHDGSARLLDDVLDDPRHGATTLLSPDERRELVAFLMSL